jgi:Icc-related predicted phosphoesterase
MRRFLICSGVHSRRRGLDWLRRAVDVRRPDGVLFAGGVLDRSRQYAVSDSTLWGLTRADSIFIVKFFETLGGLGVFTAVIPGPADTPLEDFLHMGMHAEIECGRVHLVHATLIETGNVAVAGMGGHICDGPACERFMVSRAMAEYQLRVLPMSTQPYRILLLGMPAAGPLGGPDGLPLVNELIDSLHPDLCVAPGRSEARGFQHLAHTLVVNPGTLADGWAAWLDRDRPRDEQIEMMNLRELTSCPVPGGHSTPVLSMSQG